MKRDAKRKKNSIGNGGPAIEGQSGQALRSRKKGARREKCEWRSRYKTGDSPQPR